VVLVTNDNKQRNLLDACDRVAEFLRQRSAMKGQADLIYSVHSDTLSDFGADLLASDLEVLVTAATLVDLDAPRD
jgi:hypothetical protein